MIACTTWPARLGTCSASGVSANPYWYRVACTSVAYGTGYAPFVAADGVAPILAALNVTSPAQGVNDTARVTSRRARRTVVVPRWRPARVPSAGLASAFAAC